MSSKYPKDAKTDYFMRELALDWERYFPGAERCPPVIYLDLVPFRPSMAVTIDPSLVARFTQDDPQPRHSMYRWSLTPVTGGLDLISADMDQHRRWRARLSPGFSLKNVVETLPYVIDECSTFRDAMVKSARADGQWGTDVFVMRDKLINLTFCIICHLAL